MRVLSLSTPDLVLHNESTALLVGTSFAIAEHFCLLANQPNDDGSCSVIVSITHLVFSFVLHGFQTSRLKFVMNNAVTSLWVLPFPIKSLHLLSVKLT